MVTSIKFLNSNPEEAFSFHAPQAVPLLAPLPRRTPTRERGPRTPVVSSGILLLCLLYDNHKESVKIMLLLEYDHKEFTKMIFSCLTGLQEEVGGAGVGASLLGVGAVLDGGRDKAFAR